MHQKTTRKKTCFRVLWQLTPAFCSSQFVFYWLWKVPTGFLHLKTVHAVKKCSCICTLQDVLRQFFLEQSRISSPPSPARLPRLLSPQAFVNASLKTGTVPLSLQTQTQRTVEIDKYIHIDMYIFRFFAWTHIYITCVYLYITYMYTYKFAFSITMYTYYNYINIQFFICWAHVQFVRGIVFLYTKTCNSSNAMVASQTVATIQMILA